MRANLNNKIGLKIGPAAETLQKLLDSGEEGSFDFAFIDADKTAYDHYYEQCLLLVRAGGIISIDNTLQGGKVCRSGKPVIPTPWPFAVLMINY